MIGDAPGHTGGTQHQPGIALPTEEHRARRARKNTASAAGQATQRDGQRGAANGPAAIFPAEAGLVDDSGNVWQSVGIALATYWQRIAFVIRVAGMWLPIRGE